MLIQRNKLATPLPPDRESLDQYSAIIQGIFEQLFEAGHTHAVKTTAPASNEGQVGDIYLVNVSGTYSIYAKFPSVGWKSVTLS